MSESSDRMLCEDCERDGEVYCLCPDATARPAADPFRKRPCPRCGFATYLDVHVCASFCDLPAPTAANGGALCVRQPGHIGAGLYGYCTSNRDQAELRDAAVQAAEDAASPRHEAGVLAAAHALLDALQWQEGGLRFLSHRARVAFSDLAAASEWKPRARHADRPVRAASQPECCDPLGVQCNCSLGDTDKGVIS